MLVYAVLLLSVAMASAKAILSKAVKRTGERAYETLLSNTIIFATAFVVLLLFCIGSPGVLGGMPVILPMLYGLFTVGAQVAFMQAVSLGPVSLSSLVYSCGFLLPTTFGAVYYREAVSGLQLFGIVLIVLSFALSVDRDKSISARWAVVALLSLLCSGMVGLVQKLFVIEYPQASSDMFLIIAFGCMVALSGLTFGILRLYERKMDHDGQRAEPVKPCRRPLAFLLVLGCIVACVNRSNTYLAGALPSVIFFPVMNGGTILLTSLLSVPIFRERPSVRQWLSIAVGIVGILCIGIGKNV